jgi:branched-chain amino acid transport system substrate-binding protein
MDSNVKECVRALGTNVSRRRLIKGAALTAGASAFSFYFPAVRGAEAGTIRIGWIAAVSGPGALFGEAVPFVKAQLDKIFAGGLEIGGKRYSVEILLRDSQSSINVATQAVTELISREKVDLIVAPEGLAAVGGGQMATINRTPMVSTLFPSDAMIGMRGGPQAYSNNGTPWTFHFLFDTADIGAAYLGMWEPVRKRTNQKVGTFYVDQPAARGFADPEHGLPAALKSGGYTTVEGGMFKIETDDFSNQVSTFKNGNAQILTGFMFANHFAAFWRGAAQSGYKPEIVTIAAAFLFPGGIDALGDRGDGLSTEIWWSPQLPYVSSLTGESAKALAAAWEDKQGAQWTPVLGYTHALWEVAVHALKASGDPKDKEAVRSAFAKTRLDTVVGKVDFTTGPVPGIAKTALVAGQWRRTKSGKYKYDLRVTYKGAATGFEAQDEFKLLSELS